MGPPLSEPHSSQEPGQWSQMPLWGQWGMLEAWGAREGVWSVLPCRGSILSRDGRGEVWGRSPGVETWEQQEEGVQPQGARDCIETHRRMGVQAVAYQNSHVDS